MPRSARTIIPGYFYHLTHRGNNKQQIFFSSNDFRYYLHILEESSLKYGMKIMAYCLMKNHVHLVAMADAEGAIPQTIKVAHGKYAQHFNKSQKSVGHVWQGRYYSCLLDEAHLVAAIRYVERNPVRAGFVASAWDWPWSSAEYHTLGHAGIVRLLDHRPYIDIPLWRTFLDIEDGTNDLDQIRLSTKKGKAWTTEEFRIRIETAYGIDLKIRPNGRPWK